MATGSLDLPDTSPTQTADRITAGLHKVKKSCHMTMIFWYPFGLFMHEIKDKPLLLPTWSLGLFFFSKNNPALKYIPKPPIAPRYFQNQAPSLSICGGWAGSHWCSASAACSLHAEEREACWQRPPCPQQLPRCRGQAKHSQQLHCCET